MTTHVTWSRQFKNLVSDPDLVNQPRSTRHSPKKVETSQILSPKEAQSARVLGPPTSSVIVLVPEIDNVEPFRAYVDKKRKSPAKTKSWKADEDLLLEHVIKEMLLKTGEIDWRKVTKSFPARTLDEVQSRFAKTKHSMRLRGDAVNTSGIQNQVKSPRKKMLKVAAFLSDIYDADDVESSVDDHNNASFGSLMRADTPLGLLWDENATDMSRSESSATISDSPPRTPSKASLMDLIDNRVQRQAGVVVSKPRPHARVDVDSFLSNVQSRTHALSPIFKVSGSARPFSRLQPIDLLSRINKAAGSKETLESDVEQESEDSSMSDGDILLEIENSRTSTPQAIV